jgi:hypothetical protein
MNTEKIKAGRHFGIESWPKIKHSALRLAMAENQKIASCRDAKKIKLICDRFKICQAFGFYSKNKELFWEGNA